MRIPTLAFGLLTSTILLGQGIWQVRANLPSSFGRWGSVTFSLGGVGYVAGGYNGTNDLNEVWAYVPGTDSWSQRAPLPVDLRLASGFAINGKGYVIAGLRSTSDHQDGTYEYDPVANTWTQRATFPASDRYGMASFVIDGIGYVACGNSGSATGPYHSEMWAYDPATNNWNQRASMPGQTRFACSGFSVDGKGYVFGGRLNDQTYSSELFQYDPATDTWTQRNSLPATARSYPQTWSSAGRGYVIAGSDLANAGLTDVWAYHPTSDSWTQLASYPGSGYWGGAAFTIGDRYYSGLGRYNQSIPTELYQYLSPYVGMDEHEAWAPLDLYPNPASTDLKLQLPIDVHGGQLLISNSLGQLVQEFTVNGAKDSTVQLALQGLPSGMYSLALVAKDGRHYARFIKQ